MKPRKEVGLVIGVAGEDPPPGYPVYKKRGKYYRTRPENLVSAIRQEDHPTIIVTNEYVYEAFRDIFENTFRSRCRFLIFRLRRVLSQFR